MSMMQILIPLLDFCSSDSDEKTKILLDMSDKYRGEKGEEEVFTALQDAFSQEVGAIISSHKTGFSILEKKLADEVKNIFDPGTYI